MNYSENVISYSATGTRTIYVKVTRTGYQDWLGSGTVTISQAQLTVSGTSVADKLCDNVCIIARGRKLFDGTLDELKAAHPGCALEQIFLEMTSHE